MIEREALLDHRAGHERLARRQFTAALEEERDAVETYGQAGFDTGRWQAALLNVWKPAAGEWSEYTADVLAGGKSKDVTDEPGILQELWNIVTGKAASIVEVSEEEWLAVGEGAWTPERVTTMAQTETVQATGWGQHQTAAASDLTLWKIWQSIIDDRTRPTHLDANGQRQLLNDPFEVGGAALQWPADAGGPLSEIINCRCWEDYEKVPDDGRSSPRR